MRLGVNQIHFESTYTGGHRITLIVGGIAHQTNINTATIK